MNYSVEQRGSFFVAADREAGIELAPWFYNAVTALEVGRRTEAPEPESQFMSGIPCVLIDTPIPRPADVMHIHPKSVRDRLAKGETADSIFKRHRLNPAK